MLISVASFVWYVDATYVDATVIFPDVLLFYHSHKQIQDNFTVVLCSLLCLLGLSPSEPIYTE